MLTRLTVRGFKSLRDVDVELGQLSVLVGGNGCGKTSSLEAIRFLAETMRPRTRTTAVQLPLYRAGLDRLRTRGHDGAVEIVAAFRSSSMSGTIAGTFEDHAYAVAVRGDGFSHRISVTSSPRPDIVQPNYVDLMVEGELPTAVLRFAEGIQMYGLDARSMALPIPQRSSLGWDTMAATLRRCFSPSRAATASDSTRSKLTSGPSFRGFGDSRSSGFR